MARNRLAKLTSRNAQLVGLTAPVEIKAEASAPGEAPKPATFAAIGYSGGLVPGHTTKPSLPHPYVIDLQNTTKARNNFANLDHKSDQRVGHLTKVDNNGSRLYIEGTLSAATKFRDEVAQSTRDGMPWEVSIEANLGGQKFIPRGETVRVNGQQFSGPIFVFAKNKFTDVAFVSHGADDGNAVKIAASSAGENQMNEFEKWLAACGIDAASISDTQRQALLSAYEAEQKAKLAADGDGDALDGVESKMKAAEEKLAKMAADFEFKASLAEVVARAKVEHPNQTEVIAKLAANAETERWSMDKLELEIIKKTRPTGVTGLVHRQHQADAKVYEAALAMTAGLPNIEKHYSEDVLTKVEDCGLRQFSLQQALLTAAASNGYLCRPGQRINAGNVREVLEYAFPSREARLSGFSGVSMSGPLGAVANKSIVEGYTEDGDDTWREIAEVKPVGNLQQYTVYRMLDSLEYAEIGPTGMIEHGTLDTESYTRQAKTYAKMLGISRTDIINDDLGAFADIRKRLGAGAKKKFNNIFWAAFINNSSFFTAARTNYASGSTTNLGTDGVGLGLGVLAFRKMTSPSADSTKRIGNGMRPEILLAPPELEANAKLLHVGRNIVTGANTTTPDANIYAGLYRPVIQNRLSDSAFTGYSTTAWYLFGGGLKPMVVSFLNGNETPIVESTDADFNQLGIQFRGYHDFGCDQSEYLSGVKVKGAA